MTNFFRITNVQLRSATGSLVGEGREVILKAKPGPDVADELAQLLPRHMGGAYCGASFSFEDLGDDDATVAALLEREFAGSTIRFAAEPYHFGKGKVERVEPCTGRPGMFIATLRTTDATVVSRWGGHHSSQPYNGREVRLYPIMASDFVRNPFGEPEPILRHVYPC